MCAQPFYDQMLAGTIWLQLRLPRVRHSSASLIPRQNFHRSRWWHRKSRKDKNSLISEVACASSPFPGRYCASLRERYVCDHDKGPYTRTHYIQQVLPFQETDRIPRLHRGRAYDWSDKVWLYWKRRDNWPGLYQFGLHQPAYHVLARTDGFQGARGDACPQTIWGDGNAKPSWNQLANNQQH